MIQSRPGDEPFDMKIDSATEEITIFRCGQVFLRFQPSPDHWAMLATAGLIINGRYRREEHRRLCL